MRAVRCILAIAACLLPFRPSIAASAPKDAFSLSYRIVPRQKDAFACGEAVAEGILALVGQAGSDAQASIRALDPDIPSSRSRAGGLSLRGLQAILAAAGVESAPFRLDYRSFVSGLGEYAPIIVHFDRPVPHYALALGRSRFGIAVADPAEGLRMMSDDEFVTRWSGAALAIAARSGAARNLRQAAETAAEDARTRVSGLHGTASRGSAPIPDSMAIFGVELGFQEGSPSVSAVIGSGSVSGTGTGMGTAGELGVRYGFAGFPELHFAVEFDRTLRDGAGLTLRTEAASSASLRASLRVWLVDDPLALGAEAGAAISAENGVTGAVAASLLYAINARTSLRIATEVDFGAARISQRLRLHRKGGVIGWWFETGASARGWNLECTEAGVSCAFGIELSQKLDST